MRSVVLSALAGLVFFILAVPTETVAAQRFTWPEQSQNLKVLPSTTSAEDMSTIMRGFTGALGVRCSHCHVGEEGQPLSEFDFASDANEKKDVARAMLRMVEQINQSLDAAYQGSNSIEVTCRTCHRGNHWPITIEQELDAALESGGIDDAVDTYRSLRETFYGAGAYDFSEPTMTRYAMALGRAGSTDEAIALLRLNLEYHPDSGNAYLTLGIVYQQAGRVGLARIHTEKALLLDPGNRQALQLLDRLSGG